MSEAVADRSERDGGWVNLLGRVRTEPRPRAVALFVALTAGIAVASIHWLGLVVAGALVGTLSRTRVRAAAYGLGVGAIVLVATIVTLGSDAAVVLGMEPATYLLVTSAVGLPLVGSLARFVV